MNPLEYEKRKKKRVQQKIAKKKAKKKRVLKAKVKKSTKILLILMLLYFAYKYISLEMQYQHLVKQRDELKATIEITENHQEDLLKQVEDNQSEKYIEDLARRYLGLVYPDERIFKEVEVDSIEGEE